MQLKKNPSLPASQVSGSASVSRAQESLGSFLSLFNPPKILQVQNLPRLLSGIVDEAVRITGAERGTLYLVDNKKGLLTSYIAHGLEMEEITLPLGSGVAGHVVKTGKVYNCTDAYQCSFFDQRFDVRNGFVTRSLLSAPIRNHENLIIGVIQLVNKHPSFTANDESFIRTFASYVAISIENAHLYREREKTFKSAVEMITSAIDKRDPATAGHSARVSKLCLLMAQEMRLSETEQTVVEYSALLHDIGKIGVPDAVLLKPGKLDDREYAAIKQHAIHTKEILHKMHWPKEWSDIPLIAAMHHERLDGSGYPERHHGLEMPTIARILAIADTYDALVAIDRPYRRASSHAKVIEYLDQEVKKGLYDKKVYLTLKNIELFRLQPIYGDRIYSHEP